MGNGNERKYNKDDKERMFGIETRSLKGCHELLEVLLSAYKVFSVVNETRFFHSALSVLSLLIQ